MDTLDTSAGPSHREILSARYAAALVRYLDGAGEAALQQAYEVGRAAVTDVPYVGLLDMVLLHHLALEQTPQMLRAADNSLALKAAGEFLAESLSAYEMAYRSYQERNAALRHINDTFEEETRRVAHLLHDEAGQSLFAAQLSLAELEAKVDQSIVQDIQSVVNVISQVGEQLRDLSHELRPTVLDDLGLVAAIEFLGQGISKRARIPVAVRSSIQGRLPAPVEVALFRAVQEALTNVAKHSKATRAEVTIDRQGQALVCTVRDDGVGLDPANATVRTKGGLGLIGIRERLDSIGGELEVRPQPTRGTLLVMTIQCEV